MKSFKEIYETNVNKYVEIKEQSGVRLSYLSWAYAWAEVKKLDEKANYQIHENADGNPFFVSQFGIDVKVSVTINNVTHTMRLPVMDGANKAMKTESYKYTVKSGEKTVKAADAFDINKTIMRCLVKAIAMHGLGLYIYAGEDIPNIENDSKMADNTVKTQVKDAPAELKEIVAETKVEETQNFKFTYIAKGNTYKHKDSIKKIGFFWNAEEKVYFRNSNSPDLFDKLPKLDGVVFERLED